MEEEQRIQRALSARSRFCTSEQEKFNRLEESLSCRSLFGRKDLRGARRTVEPDPGRFDDLANLYKKHRGQVAGHTFYQLHLLFDKHFNEQLALVDAVAERIQLLGDVSLAMATKRW